MIDERPEIECPECDGYGFIPPLVRMRCRQPECEHCAGTGWRQPTDDRVERHVCRCLQRYVRERAAYERCRA